MDYVYTVMNIFIIYLILSLSANVLTGFGGIFSLFQAGLFGIGAYAYAILATKYGLPFLISSTFAVMFTSLFSLIFSLVVIRVSKEYLVLLTIAFQILITTLFYVSEEITGGPYGITDIPYPEIFGIKIVEPYEFFVIETIILIFITALLYRIFKTPFGIAVKGFREDEILLSSYGVSPGIVKVKLFTLSGFLASISGTLYASYAGFIDPSSFTLMESVFIISTVLIGGPGRILGSFIGTFILVGIPEIMRYALTFGEHIFFIRQILLSLIIILVLYFKPKGLVGDYAPR